MKKDSRLSEDDQDLFREAMKGVRRLEKSNRVVLEKSRASLVANKQPFSRNNKLIPLQDPSELHANGESFLSHRISGIRPQLLKKLRQGKILPEAVLDLHGMTVNQARHQVFEFIRQCQIHGLKCAKIIHGKGSENGPSILKSMVAHWLCQLNGVLAYSSAKPHQGGTGALLILLKSTGNYLA